ncbi:hypothetical protein CHS0354_011297 [Potamilus streckersoni]|uniref:Uncharacterized protein n=1 Tax=Potamilus streckersoni TaxID=2493646 RepID=A0AAE0S8V0_9BIVA|nr:hypothetical protein CHS0354_011297 [Potamilus streckersoni]
MERDTLELQIRKQRKKLRQIEHLERLDRLLTDEEIVKVERKDRIREELLDLLADLNENVNNSAFVQEDDNVTDSSLATDQSTSVSEVLLEESHNIPKWGKTQLKSTSVSEGLLEESKMGENPVEAKDNPTSVTEVIKAEDGQELKISYSKAVMDALQPQESKKSKKETSKSTEKSAKVRKGSSLQQTMKESRYQVLFLEGHNDVITAVEAADSILVTASRDTTVKIWDLRTLTEIQNLGGHTDSVTDVVILDKEQSATVASKLQWTDAFNHLVFSGSMDCSFKLWSAKTGQQIKSVYTYNPVTKLAYHPGQDIVITVSDGGKLELWDVVTSLNIQSLRAHDDAVTALCLMGNTVATSTSSGEIKVHEIRDRSLICLFASENLQNTSGRLLTPRYIRSLAATKDYIFYGDDGINIKVLNWKKGLVRKICNHAGDFGITDALCCHDKLLFASAFDLDTGIGSLNVFQVDPDLQYLITLTDEDTGHIMDVTYCQGADCIITGGMELKVWRKLTSGQSVSEGDLVPNVIPKLIQQAVDSDMESDVDFSESESEADFNGGEDGDSNSSQQNVGWLSWCSVL